MTNQHAEVVCVWYSDMRFSMYLAELHVLFAAYL